MSQETTVANFWGTLVRWIVALVAPVVDLSRHDGDRPLSATRVVAPLRVLSRNLEASVAAAPPSAPALRRRAWLGSGVRPWTPAGFGLPPCSPPSATPTWRRGDRRRSPPFPRAVSVLLRTRASVCSAPPSFSLLPCRIAASAAHRSFDGTLSASAACRSFGGSSKLRRLVEASAAHCQLRQAIEAPAGDCWLRQPVEASTGHRSFGSALSASAGRRSFGSALLASAAHRSFGRALSASAAHC
jgi:hypothetical protein